MLHTGRTRKYCGRSRTSRRKASSGTWFLLDRPDLTVAVFEASSNVVSDPHLVNQRVKK
jgi:hypothetical protein